MEKRIEKDGFRRRLRLSNRHLSACNSIRLIIRLIFYQLLNDRPVGKQSLIYKIWFLSSRLGLCHCNPCIRIRRRVWLVNDGCRHGSDGTQRTISDNNSNDDEYHQAHVHVINKHISLINWSHSIDC